MKKNAFVFFLFVLMSHSAMAHSVHFDVTKQAPVVSVNAYFTQSSPMTNTGVYVYAPGEDQPYQTGQTDNKGYFAFIPSEAGDWVFEIDDQHGHRNKVTISIDEDFLKGETKAEDSPAEKPEEKPEESSTTPAEDDQTGSASGIPFIYKLLFGLALIFGITGIYYGVRATHSQKKP